MITMEFEELQKIWDVQNNEPLYAINAQALHNRILSKKKRAYHTTNFSELLLIFVNIGTGCFILGVNFFTQKGNIILYLMSVWMLITALYVLANRLRRIKGEYKFDRSMVGDLDHAISMATYQVRLGRIMRWNILPIGVLTFLGVWDSGKPIWMGILLLIFFAIAHFAGGWELTIYKNRKRELEILQKKLKEEEAGSDDASF
jgi:hypothetical protein